MKKLFALLLTLLLIPVESFSAEDRLLFHLSGETLNADYAKGDPEPVVVQTVDIVPGGVNGKSVSCAHYNGILAYNAPGNMYARRGTVSFFFRGREPLGRPEFKIFQASYREHTSFDMTFLRIDWNGRGFDAMVSDLNLAFHRLTHIASPTPAPDKWTHVAFAWDENVGVRLYVNGIIVARKDTTVVLDAELAYFGFFGNLINPISISVGNNCIRGGDVDELYIYDAMLDAVQIENLSKGRPAGAGKRQPVDSAEDSWFRRWGWNRNIPPLLPSASTMVRKVEIHEAYDLKQWVWRATDGFRETTWPTVYNRSRIPGRFDYFVFPDWNCYSISGKSITFELPQERWNYIEITGGAYGVIELLGSRQTAAKLFEREADVERTFHRSRREYTGGRVRFTNEVIENPIGEFSVFNVRAGSEPNGYSRLVYRLSGGRAPEDLSIAPMLQFISNSNYHDERTVVFAVPEGSAHSQVFAQKPGSRPMVHVLIPWSTIPEEYRGLDGVVIEVPPLDVEPTHGDLFPMNIQVRDPLFPSRNLMDFSFSVRPGQPYRLWLDSRDRILPEGNALYLIISGAGSDFGSNSLAEAKVSLIFKDPAIAAIEHQDDRFVQLKDNWGHACEGGPVRSLLAYERIRMEYEDLLRVNPEHYPGRNYKGWITGEGYPPFEQPEPPADVPLWAFRQIECLRSISDIVLWWIDNRQIENGEFGGGLGDDSCMTHMWPVPALMGVEPEKITDSLSRLMEAFYESGHITDGLGTYIMDGLHATEEGSNVQAQLFMLKYGDPRLTERIMETTRGFERITGINPAGHRHLRSYSFSSRDFFDEGPWLYSREQTYRIFNPGMSLVEFNGNPRAKKLLVEVADGIIAHRKKDSEGRYRTSVTVNFLTDEERPGGFSSPDHILWGVWRWTGNDEYLKPIIDDRNWSVGGLNANALDILDLRKK